jgi:hypothetical protein
MSSRSPLPKVRIALIASATLISTATTQLVQIAILNRAARLRKHVVSGVGIMKPYWMILSNDWKINQMPCAFDDQPLNMFLER